MGNAHFSLVNNSSSNQGNAADSGQGTQSALWGKLPQLLEPAKNAMLYLITLCGELDRLEEKMDNLWRRKEKVETYMSAFAEPSTQVHERLADWVSQVEELNKQVPLIGAHSPTPGRLSRTTLLHKVQTLYDTGATLIEASPMNIPDPVVTVEISQKKLPRGSTALVQVQALLAENDVRLVGVTGAALIGKTTLLQAINNGLAELPARGNAFGVVIWITVSREPNVGKIQKEIGDRLGLSLSADGPVESHAETLRRTLTRRRFLLLLDDVWTPLDLQQIGIPLVGQSRGKIVFSTQFRKACEDMHPDINWLEMKPLDEQESWELFWEKARKREHEQKVRDDQLLRHLSKEVIQQCGGIPIAVVSLARALGGTTDSPECWRNAGHQLASSASGLFRMNAQVIDILMLRFATLGDKGRACFLYCSLFPCGYAVDEERLVDYWIGEGFESADDQGIQGERAKCLSHVDDLKNDFWLFNSRGSAVKKVQLPAYLHQLATTQHPSNSFIVSAAKGLTSVLDVNNWSGARRVSLMKNEISSLPMPGGCPRLLTLFVNHNPHLQFEDNGDPRNMERPNGIAVVLQVRSPAENSNPQSSSSSSSLSSVPSSSTSPPPPPSSVVQCHFFRCMNNLKVLDLSFTSIKGLPSDVQMLTELRYLNLSHTKISSLPPQVGDLHKLRQLDLSGTDDLSDIPSVVISQLNLEILNLYDSSYLYHLHGASNEQWSWLSNLRHLKELGVSIEIRSPLVISKPRIFPSTKFLMLKGSSDSSHGELKLVDNSFEELVVLKMSGIRLSTVVAGSHLPLLRRLHIEGCHQLRDIRWAQQLPSLEEIHLVRCLGIRNLLTEERNSSMKQLREIQLRGLDNIETISSRGLLQVGKPKKTVCQFPSLEIFGAHQCPKLKEPYFKKEDAPKLKYSIVVK